MEKILLDVAAYVLPVLFSVVFTQGTKKAINEQLVKLGTRMPPIVVRLLSVGWGALTAVLADPIPMTQGIASGAVGVLLRDSLRATASQVQKTTKKRG
tara:strand:+ start:2808 stop:3101 length:294 start_codon:yes stop_codon:yes gene_type:complete